MEGLQRPGGVNISKGRVRVEGIERSHMAAENIGEQQRMLGMKFYITHPHSTAPSPSLTSPAAGARDATCVEPLVCIFIIRDVFSILINVNSCKFWKAVGH